MKLIIYGAQAIALGTYRAIKELFTEQNIECFLVTEKGNNPSVLSGIPVYTLSGFASKLFREEKEKIEVLIATPEPVMEAIEKSLDEVGLYYHVRMDSMRWAKLQELAFVRFGKFMPLAAYPVGFHRAEIQVYKAKFFKDKALNSKFENPNYMRDLQVGTVRTDIRVADLLDCEDDNISEKNANYSELTGLYWIWKNQILLDEDYQNKYYGLAHYRRIFDLSEDDLLRIKDNDIDVILPYFMPYEPNIEEHHKRYLSEDEWNAVLQALEELDPDNVEGFKEILKQEYMYNYNIIISKGKVLADYCSWLFPILFRVEEICNSDGCKEPNRYIGYVGETLETLYFMYNKDKFRIAHAGCRFLM